MQSNLIIFSKDRPCQLDATLRSVELNAKDFFALTTVIYKATDDKYDKGYSKAKRLHPRVCFTAETDFKKDVLQGMYASPFTTFLTDDDIIFEPLESEIMEYIDDDVACASLRLGKNINYCYSNDKQNRLQQVPMEYIVKGKGFSGYIEWDWRGEKLDWGYPLSVTAHVFRTGLIRNLTEECDFDNPNTYEGTLQHHLGKLPPKMIAYKESRIVGVPANRVNDVAPNRFGLTYPYTTGYLNELFLSGKWIDFKRMDFSDIYGAQQELKYKF